MGREFGVGPRHGVKKKNRVQELPHVWGGGKNSGPPCKIVTGSHMIQCKTKREKLYNTRIAGNV